MINNDNKLLVVRCKPTLLHLFPSTLRKINLHERIRFLFMFTQGYVIYLLKRDSTDIGYCVLAKGGGYDIDSLQKKMLL